MNYIIAEIQDDDIIRVIYNDIPEDKISSMVSDTQFANRNIVAIPCRPIVVKSFNYGYNIEVEIK